MSAAAVVWAALGQAGVLAGAAIVGVLTARLHGSADGEGRPGPLLWEVWRREARARWIG